MADEPTLEIRVIGSPPIIEIERRGPVPDDLWFALPTNLGPGAVSAPAGRLRVPLERFLASRRWLSRACRTYEVGVQPDAKVEELLRRTLGEQESVRRRLRQKPSPSPREAPGEALATSRYVRELRTFQIRDLTTLLDLEHGANFSVPGAGKTTVTYALYESERLRGRVARLLVVAPLSAFDAWESEAILSFSNPPIIHHFDGHRIGPAEVVLVNYQRLAAGRRELADFLLEAPTHLVLDESHRMKRGRLGEWGSACLDLAHLARRRDILTGTPAPHSPRDFIALLDFLWPTQARWILPSAALGVNPPDDAMEQVNEALRPLFVRTTKRELDLDPPTIRVELVKQGELQAAIYDALRNRYAGMFDLSRRDQAMLAQMGEVTMYLLEAATNPGLLAGLSPDQGLVPFRYPPLAIPPGSHLADLVADYSVHERPPKFEKLAVMLERNADQGKKTLVWSNFVGNLLTLEQLFARYQPALIYGGIPPESAVQVAGARTREGELARFRRDDRCMVLLANPAATAEGVSLHDVCHDAIYLERTFNAGHYLQSLDRIHRLGLPKGTETSITFLLTEGTIDESVDGRVRLKAERLSQMLDDPDLVTMALPDEEDYGEVIDDLGDLDALFAHLAGDAP